VHKISFDVCAPGRFCRWTPLQVCSGLKTLVSALSLCYPLGTGFVCVSGVL
jgi:hypothetical protein